MLLNYLQVVINQGSRNDVDWGTVKKSVYPEQYGRHQCMLHVVACLKM